jgi:hypothetical protein
VLNSPQARPLPANNSFGAQLSEIKQTSSSIKQTSSAGASGFMESVLSVVVPLVGGLFKTIVENEITKFQQKYPGQTVFEVVEKAIWNLLQENQIPQKIYDKLHLATFVAKVSNFAAPLIKLVDDDPNVQTPRDFVIHWDTAKIASALEATLGKAAQSVATNIENSIFHHDPTGVIQRLATKNTLSLSSIGTTINKDLGKVLSFFAPKAMSSAVPDTIINDNDKIRKSVKPENQHQVFGVVNKIASAQSIASTPGAFQFLVNSGTTNSVGISNTPAKDYIEANKSTMGVQAAKQTHAKAMDIRVRNEMILMNLKQYITGTGLSIIDGEEDASTRRMRLQQHLDKIGSTLSLENLFGSMDEPIDDGLTVYSMASYFVDLLQYLRNNNLDKEKGVTGSTFADTPDVITGTVLDSLFRRRPDLGNLELSTENTDTLIPYIDLANEVMESFIMNMPSYGTGPLNSKANTIEVFNVTTEDSDELLSQPQNINMDAYREVVTSVYPPTLPYHEPLDTQRVFLKFLKVDRADMVDNFRQKLIVKSVSKNANSSTSATTVSSVTTALTDFQRTALNRQVDCERLGLIQEEYLILTKQAFWELKYFQYIDGPSLTMDQYHQKIGIRPLWEYWGYSSEAELSSSNKRSGSGLLFVESQLLPRSGLAYTDLIEIIQTQFVNPAYPSGQTKTILDSLQYSYRFLQTLVNYGASSSTKRYSQLADFLVASKKLVNIEAILEKFLPKSTSSKSNLNQNPKVKSRDIKNWVYSNFKKLGSIIVLDSGQSPRLEISGKVFATVNSTSTTPKNAVLLPAVGDVSLTEDGLVDKAGNNYKSGIIGTLSEDGSIKDSSGNAFAHVIITGKVLYGNPLDKTGLNDAFPGISFSLSNDRSWSITDNFLEKGTTSPSSTNGATSVNSTTPPSAPVVVEWVLDENRGGSSNIDDVQLIHLDGSPLSLKEWDRLHQFIRIWRKLGWSISDTDRALNGSLSKPPIASQNEVPNSSSAVNGNVITNDIDGLISFEDFQDEPSDDESQGDSPIEPKPTVEAEIDPDLIHELASITQILPLTSLTLEQLLTFWTPMSYRGTSSLYYKLFFTRGLRGASKAFNPDVNGDYFTGKPETIANQALVISAALGLNASDLSAMSTVAYNGELLVTDVLSMANLSAIYKLSLFAKVLEVQIIDLNQVLQCFTPSNDPTQAESAGPFDIPLGSPFDSPSTFLGILQIWNKMKSISFPWQELRYILDSVSTPHDPLAPTADDSLLISKTLHDGIAAIQAANPYVTQESAATDDVLKAKTSLVFESSTVTQILALINGATPFMVDAPNISDNNFPLLVSNLLNKRVTYTPIPANSQGDSQSASAKLKIVGILTDDDKGKLKAVINNASDVTAPSQKSSAVPNSSINQLILDWSNAVDL